MSGARVPPEPRQEPSETVEPQEHVRPFVGLLVGATVWAQHRLRVYVSSKQESPDFARGTAQATLQC